MSAGQPTILAIAGDPGGANAVAPVLLALLADSRFRLQALAYHEATHLWGKRGIPVEALGEGMTPDQILARFRRNGAKLLLAGTSFNPVGLEKLFVATARAEAVPSVSLLDFWSHYRLRFADASGALRFQPDRIAVIDERARDEMIAEGFEAHRLVITGHPAFDGLVEQRARFSTEERGRIRRGMGVPEEARLVMFVSQPLSGLFGASEANPLFPGYTEQSVSRMVVDALDRIAVRRGCSIVLMIQLHPRDAVAKYAGLKGRHVRVMASGQTEPHDAVMAADLVVGMNSMLLVEACYLGCLTVSIQPGLRYQDMLPTNRNGLSQAVFAEPEIEPVLERFMLDQASRARQLDELERARPGQGATGRVVRLICEMLN